MDIEQVKQQQVHLYARKAMLLDEVKNLEAGLAQLNAIIEYTTAMAEASKSQPKE